MRLLEVSLFGKFCVRCGDQILTGLDACKVQELFCYLILHIDRPHHREKLAQLLWCEQSPAQSKSYLRRTLWQLQNAIPDQELLDFMLRVESDWIQLNNSAALWVDAAVFEQAFISTQGTAGIVLDDTAANTLIEAIKIYQGDLLEGWYQDWCLFERERYQQMLLMMLDKLMAYCEKCGAYEEGITYGMRILRYDLARERTHRQLMRLYYFADDRTGALRQYERCTTILHQELNVKPATSTEKLRVQIEADSLEPLYQAPTWHSDDAPSLQDTLQWLQNFDNILTKTHQQIQHAKRALTNL